jgi:hypothetical protein
LVRPIRRGVARRHDAGKSRQRQAWHGYSTNEAETFACDDFCKRGSLCTAFVIALYELVITLPGPFLTGRVF